MQTDEHQRTATTQRLQPAMALVVRVLLTVVVVAVGWFGYSILSVEPEEAKGPKGEPRRIKTRVAELRVTDYATTIRTQGVVRPHNEVILSAEVAGKIIRVAPGFEDGAFFADGDVLLELDPSDYETAVIVAQAQVARALSAHAQEETRVKQARLNWEDLGYEEEPNDLVLRLPQLREAQANVDSAEAQLARTKRDLDRTKVRAPFGGRVRQRSVGLGQSIGPGTALGSVFASDFAEVRLPISGRDMAFLELPEGDEDSPVDVELHDVLNQDIETVWKAKIVRTEGTLDPSSLELFAIARIDDPFGRRSGEPPLRVGQPVVGYVPGRILENVVIVPRMAVRQLNRIYVVDRDTLTLEARTIDPIWSDEEHVVVRDPALASGCLLATTHLVYAPNGAKVEILPASEEKSPETAGTGPSGEGSRTAQVQRGSFSK